MFLLPTNSFLFELMYVGRVPEEEPYKSMYVCNFIRQYSQIHVNPAIQICWLTCDGEVY